MAFFARNEANLLQVDHEESVIALMRHPLIEGGYFRELQDVWPAWREKITASSIYANYFAPAGADIGIPYWQSLIDASKGRPVFQECRTSGRIGAIKSNLGAYHIYLWRNPWDQWWSCKVTPYFDVANQLIIRATRAPAPVALLRKALGLEDEVPEDLSKAFAHFGAKPVDSEKSYQVFYMLWCLGLREGVMHADLLLNIDRLSDSPDYRNEMQRAFLNSGIVDIDFSDCHVPQGCYLKQDEDFFEPLEKQVHQWLREGGWSPTELERILAIRRQFEPIRRGMPHAAWLDEGLIEQASRFRALVIRYENQVAEKVRLLARQETQTQQTEARAQQAETLAQQAESQAAQASERATLAEARAQQAEAQAVQASERATLAEAHAQQAEARAQQAETRAQQAEARAQQAESQTAQASERATLAEVRTQQAEAASEMHLAQLHAVYASTSWRITAPLRWAGTAMRRLSLAALKLKVKVLLQHAALYVRRRPWLKRAALSVLNRMPRLKARLGRVAMGISATPPLQPQHMPTELAHLSPRARQIYANLTSALAKRQLEKS